MNTTKLTYTCEPNEAFVSRVATFTIHGMNTSKEAVTFTNSDYIEIKVPKTMVADYGPDPTVPPGKGYIVNKTSLGVYFVTFPNGAILHENEEVEVIFGQVTVVAKPIDADITVLETFQGNTNEKPLTFSVQELKPGVIAWIDNSVLSEFGSTYLNWESHGISSIAVSGFPDIGQKTDLPVKGKTKIYFPKDGTGYQAKYTIIGRAGNKIIQELGFTITRIPPQLYYFKTEPETKTVKSPNLVNLVWRSNFATSVILTTPIVPNWRQRVQAVASSKKVNPAKDLSEAYSNTWSQLPAYAEYTLTVNGFKEPKSQTVRINLEPTKLLYFKYEQPNFQGGIKSPAYDPMEYTGSRQQSGPDNTFTLTLFQPGGTSDVYYLGKSDTTHPQIQFFEFTKKGSLFNLQWQSHNCTKLELVLPDGTKEAITGKSLADGTKNGVKKGQYTLNGTAADGSTIVSVLEVA